MIAIPIVLAILLIIALLRLGVTVRYDEDGLFVSAFAGPVRIQLFPREKKPKEKNGKKKQRKKKKEKPSDSEEEEDKKKGGGVRKLFDLVSAVSESLRRLRRRLLVNELTLRYEAAGSDPAKTAMSYGYANAAISTVMPTLENIFRIKKRSVGATVDFESDSPAVFAKLKMSLAVWELVYIAAGLDIKKLKKILLDN